jgi:hypothetical protein
MAMESLPVIQISAILTGAGPLRVLLAVLLQEKDEKD